MKNIKTVQDVLNVPATEFISLINRKDYTCPFCGSSLPRSVVGFGRDKCVQYHTCSCAVAQAADAHNRTLEALEREAEMKEHAKRMAEEAKRREEAAKKPESISIEEILCVASGLILPGVNAIAADDKVNYRMKLAGIVGSSAKERLMAYAEQRGFRNGLENAVSEIAEYVTKNTDISDKAKELCTKYGIPDVIIL